ncbi:MAG: quinolinate synthase NadA [Clostridia bacterium]|nr:quinolinate synthase NadA [Clostridia bacterium]MDQ7791914.1 quinolinate synthase NadA [Clostridia bacterium]
MAASSELVKQILELKRKRKAVLLSHYYQRPEIQDLADFVGDSLELSRQAENTDAEVIVFCGVHFMAESAAILSPDKLVLLPDADAGCPMADMVNAASLREEKARLNNPVVVSYVNTSAEVKAESDICCTSANVIRVVSSLPRDREILFVPDQNLGRFAEQRTGRKMSLWPGFCCIHDQLTADEVQKAKAAHPGALLVVHPECRSEVIALADHVASTSGMLRYACASPAREFIVGTEEGLLHQLSKQCPDKAFYTASNGLVCRSMKLTTLEKLALALETLEPRVSVETRIRERAILALERMLAIV